MSEQVQYIFIVQSLHCSIWIYFLLTFLLFGIGHVLIEPYTWLAQTSPQFLQHLFFCLKKTKQNITAVQGSVTQWPRCSLCFQAATKESNAEERLTPVVLAQQAAQLKQQLVSAHLDSLLGPQAHINLADPDGALARWVERREKQDNKHLESKI